jgi:hypothetical protein
MYQICKEVLALLSIIDTLTQGFATVTRKLWLIAVPVVLDLFLWLGPKVSISLVITQMATAFRQAIALLPAAGSVDSSLLQTFEALVEELQATVGHTNLLSLLAWTRLGVPSIAGARMIDPQAANVINLSGYGQLVFWQLATMVIGLLIAALYLGLLGQEVRGEKTNLIKLLSRVPVYWLRMLAVFVPLGAFLVFVFSFSFVLGPFAPFLWVILLWVVFYLSFIPQAITMAEERPLGALAASFAIVRFNFWSALWLIVLTTVINLGISYLLTRLIGSTVGMLAAILVNAYVGTGLSLAVFIFYRDRMVALRAAVQQQQQRRSV